MYLHVPYARRRIGPTRHAPQTAIIRNQSALIGENISPRFSAPNAARSYIPAHDLKLPLIRTRSECLYAGRWPLSGRFATIAGWGRRGGFRGVGGNSGLAFRGFFANNPYLNLALQVARQLNWNLEGVDAA